MVATSSLFTGSAGASASIAGLDTTASYKAGARALYRNTWVKANADIPANTAFAWGTTGPTWSPILDAAYTWGGVYDGSAEALNAVVAPTTTSAVLFVSTAAANTTDPLAATAANWIDFSNINKATFKGATPLLPGRSGMAPSPSSADLGKVLKADGTWSYPDNPWITTTNGMNLVPFNRYLALVGHTLNFPAGVDGDSISIAPQTGNWLTMNVDFVPNGTNTIGFGQSAITASANLATFIKNGTNWILVLGGSTVSAP